MLSSYYSAGGHSDWTGHNHPGHNICKARGARHNGARAGRLIWIHSDLGLPGNLRAIRFEASRLSTAV